MVRNDLGTSEQFAAASLALPVELKGGYSVVSWKRPGKEHTRYAGVPGHFEDSLAVFARVLEFWEIDDAYDIELVRRADRVTPAGYRPIDNVMAVTRTYEERRDFEVRAIMITADRLTEHNLYRPSQGRYPCGPAQLGLGRHLFRLSSIHLLHGPEFLSDPEEQTVEIEAQEEVPAPQVMTGEEYNMQEDLRAGGF